MAVTRREVGKWLARRPEVLSGHQVEPAYAVTGR